MKSKRLFLMFVTFILSAFFVAACSSNSDSEPEQESEQKSSSTLESDEDLKTQLEAEKGIESAMVQVVEGDESAVNVDIQLSADQTMTADEVIEKYSSVIKEKYPDQKVDLIIAKEGKLLKQTTLE